MAQSDASVSTTKGIAGSIVVTADFIMSLLRLSKASTAVGERGKLLVCTNGRILFEKESIHWE